MTLGSRETARTILEVRNLEKFEQDLVDAGGLGGRVVTCDQEGIVEGGSGGAEGDDVDEGVVEEAPVELGEGSGEDHGEDQEDFEESGELAEDAGRERAIA